MDVEIAPSRHNVNDYNHMEGNRHGRERGVAIHRFLQLLSDGVPSDSALLHRISTELKIDEKDPSLGDWRMEAEQVLNNPVFRDWFDASCYDDALNEIPVCYDSGERLVHGVVDRLVIKGDTCTLIDYKTQKTATKENLGEMAVPYREQLRLYVEGLKRLWPGKRVRAYLLFTACAGAHEWRE